jgi:hypothetical protein
LVLAALATAGTFVSTARAAQADAGQSTAATKPVASQSTGAAKPVAGQSTAAAKPVAAPPARKKSPYHPESVPRSGRSFLAVTKGVDDLKVRRTNAGNLIRFSYRVTNVDQAKALNDKKATPYMIGHTSHAMLQVPVMDKVGPLRQSTAPEAGKEYWMVFSNKGDVVKTGERVSVVIGSFRVDGLMVE